MNLRPLLLCLGGIALVTAAGCKTVTGGSCHKPQPHEQAENLPPLRLPSGAEGPDTRAAMAIPELTQPALPLDPEGPCLDAPPAITAPPLPDSGVEAPSPSTAAERRRAERATDEEQPRERPQRRRPPSRPR